MYHMSYVYISLSIYIYIQYLYIYIDTIYIHTSHIYIHNIYNIYIYSIYIIYIYIFIHIIVQIYLDSRNLTAGVANLQTISRQFQDQRGFFDRKKHEWKDPGVRRLQWTWDIVMILIWAVSKKTAGSWLMIIGGYTILKSDKEWGFSSYPFTLLIAHLNTLLRRPQDSESSEWPFHKSMMNMWGHFLSDMWLYPILRLSNVPEVVFHWNRNALISLWSAKSERVLRIIDDSTTLSSYDTPCEILILLRYCQASVHVRLVWRDTSTRASHQKIFSIFSDPKKRWGRDLIWKPHNLFISLSRTWFDWAIWLHTFEIQHGLSMSFLTTGYREYDPPSVRCTTRHLIPLADDQMMVNWWPIFIIGIPTKPVTKQ